MAKLKTGRHTSAIKTSRQAERHMRRNRALKKAAREASKAVLLAASSPEKASAKTALVSAESLWDKAAGKGAIHWKTAARRKSRLAARLNKSAAK